MFESIPDELKNLNQWVCVSSGSKVPVDPRTHTAASSSDYRTWSSYATAATAVRVGDYDNIGFVFADNGIVGIDIDDGFDEHGIITDKALDIIMTCNSYTELSRSGRGFHILMSGKLPFKGRNNQNGVEIYQTGRYFIMTGNHITGTLRMAQDAIDTVVDKYFPQTLRSGNRAVSDTVYKPVWPKPNGRVPLEPEYPEITNGSRNLCLTSLAGTLRNCDYGKMRIYRELTKVNRRCCKPPLHDSELRTIVSSVMRYRV